MATKTAALSVCSVESAAHRDYQQYVNPQWVTLLNLLGMNVQYERCLGTELFTKDGRRILDFLSGYYARDGSPGSAHLARRYKDI
jgi:ornithine--oxo-acid transaminase